MRFSARFCPFSAPESSSRVPGRAQDNFHVADAQRTEYELTLAPGTEVAEHVFGGDNSTPYGRPGVVPR
jgi:hypothetical protein